MAASAVYILDVKGKVLVSRSYRGDVDDLASGIIDRFMPALLEREEENNLTPIIEIENPSAAAASQKQSSSAPVTFCYVKHNSLYLVATTCKRDAPVTLIFQFLHRLVAIFRDYFKTLEEESIRDNFVLIYELLDEVCDYGFPQTTETKILQEFITQESSKLEAAPRPPTAVTNAVSWRSDGIRYRKNEVFLDVIESVNLLAASSGTVLRSEIVGSVKMRTFLSGMPELRLGLNDKIVFESAGRTGPKNKAVELEDVKFHQCVRLSRFEADRTISFIPPDGEFELMSYRLNTTSQVKPLIWIESVIEKFSHSRVEYMIKARSQFKRRSTANNVEIEFPVPSDADTPHFRCDQGSAKYVPETDSVVWHMRSFPGGGREYLMRAHFKLPSVDSDEHSAKTTLQQPPDLRRPISVRFEIPYFTVSGLQVRYLKIIEKSGYQALPWVRYITQNGDYQLRTA